MAAKRVYRVTAESIDYFTILVEATSDDEAMDLAESIGPEYFTMNHRGEWQIAEAEAVTDYDPSDVAPPEAYDSL